MGLAVAEVAAVAAAAGACQAWHGAAAHQICSSWQPARLCLDRHVQAVLPHAPLLLDDLPLLAGWEVGLLQPDCLAALHFALQEDGMQAPPLLPAVCVPVLRPP